MKYVRTFESFRNNSKDEQVNEEFLGKLFNWIGKKWNQWGKNVAATRGGKEIEAIYQKYMKILNDEMSRKAGVDLNIMSADKMTEIKGKAVPKKESVNYRMFEAEKPDDDGSADVEKETNTKMMADTLKKKSALIDQIIALTQKRAKTEMYAVLKKNGGAAENPKLAAIINAKIEQFEFDVLQAKIKYLEKSGDTTLLPNLVKERDAMSKKIESTYKNIEGLKPVEYKVGDKAIYLLKGKTLDDWYALSEDDRKDPETENAKKVVGIKPISAISSDKSEFTFKTNDGKEFTKDSTEIMGKAPGTEEEGKIEEGDEVTWINKDKKKVKGTVAKVEGDILTFNGTDGEFTKNKSEVTLKSKSEGEEVQGQEEAQGQKKAQGQGQKKAQGQGEAQGQEKKEE